MRTALGTSSTNKEKKYKEMETKKEKHNDLGYLGDVAQYAIVKNLITNRDFFYKISSIIDPKAFTDEYVGMIVKTVMSEYAATNAVPSLKDLEYIIKDRTYDKADKRFLKDALINISKVDAEAEGDNLSESAIRFFREQELRRIITNAKNTLDRGGYSDDLKERMISQIQDISVANTDGQIVVTEDIINKSLDITSDDMVATGIEEMDEKMCGGLAKGNTGMVIAGTGVGKTTFGSIICCNAIKLGYKVMHIFFEDQYFEILHKYYSHLTKLDTREFKDLSEEAKTEVKRRIKEALPNAVSVFKNNLRLVPMENGVTQVGDIFREINTAINIDGWKPDMIYIDYLSCIQPEKKGDSEWSALGNVMKKIDAFAKRNNIAIWVAQQTHRINSKEDNLLSQSGRLSTIQGSYTCTQPATRVITIFRSGEEYDRANIYLDKARNAETWEWEGAYFNNANCQVNLSDLEDVFDEDNEDKNLY